MYKIKNIFKINKKRTTAFLVMLAMVTGMAPSNVIVGAQNTDAADNNGVISQTENSITYGPGVYSVGEDGSLELVDKNVNAENAENTENTEPEATEESVEPAPAPMKVPHDDFVDLSDRVPVSYDYEGRNALQSIDIGEYTEVSEELEKEGESADSQIDYQTGMNMFYYTQRPMPASNGVVTLEKAIPGQDYCGTVVKTSGYYRAYSNVSTEGDNSRTFMFNGVNITCKDTSADCVVLLETANASSLLNVSFSGENYITKYGSGSYTSIFKGTGGGKINVTITQGSLTISMTGATNCYFMYNNPSSKCNVFKLVSITTGGNVWNEWHAPLESAPYDPNPNNKAMEYPCYGLTGMYDTNIFNTVIKTKEEYTDEDKMKDRILMTVGDQIGITGEIISGIDPFRYKNWGNDGITYYIESAAEKARASIASSGMDGTLTAVKPGVVSIIARPNAQLGASEGQSISQSSPIDFIIGQALAPETVKVERLSETSAKFTWDGAFVDFGETDSEEITGYDIYYAQEPITSGNISNPDIVTTIHIDSAEKGGEKIFTDLEEDATYYFRIKTNSRLFGNSALSDEVSLHLYLDPVAVDTITASRIDDISMSVEWSGAGGTNIIGYKVYYSNSEQPTSLSVYKEIYLKEEYDRLAAAAEAKGGTFDPGEVNYADDYWETGTGKLTIVDKAIAPQNTYYTKVETITRPIADEEDFLLTSGLSDAYGEVYMYKSPEPPKFIEANREDNTTAHVIWKDAAGDSLYGYRVYYFLNEGLEIPFDTTMQNFNNGIIGMEGFEEYSISDDEDEDISAFEIPSPMEKLPVLGGSYKDADIEKMMATNADYSTIEEVSEENFIDISNYIGSSDIDSGNIDEEYIEEFKAASQDDSISAFAIDEDEKDPTKITSPLETNTYNTSYVGDWVSSSSNNTWLELATAGNYYFNGVNIRATQGVFNGTILFRNKGTANLHFYGNNTISRLGFTGEKASAIYINGGATVNIYNYGNLTLYSDGAYAIYSSDGTVNLRANRISSNKGYYGKVSDNTTASPTAPKSISAAKKSATSAVVSWEDADGGSYEISGYRIYYTNTGNEPTRNSDYVSFKLTDPKAQMQSNGTGSFTIDGLTPLSKYKFKIVTVTEAAASSMSTVFGETELTVNVTPPTEVTASKANAESAYVEWSGASLDEGDGKINGYRIYYTNKDGEEITEDCPYKDVAAENATSGNVVIDGLTTSTQYRFKVMTLSQYKFSELSEESNEADLTIKITPPEVIEATRDDINSVRIDWRNLYLEEGIIEYYRVYYAEGAEPTEDTSTYVDVTTSSDRAMTIIENLSDKKTYYFKIKVFSTYRNSELSDAVSIDLSTLSFAPKNITAERVDEKSANLTWSGASAEGDITSYTIYYDTDIPTHNSNHIDIPSDDGSGEGSVQISDLSIGDINYFRIQTNSTAGKSLLSSIYASAFLYKGLGIQEGITTVQTGNTYVIESSGEYTLISEEKTISNAAINIGDGVEATINIPADFVIDNSGSNEYKQSPISLGNGSKVSIRIHGDTALYGSPASDGTTNVLNGKGGNGGFAAIRVPEDATLIIKGTGNLKAYGGDAGDGGNSIRNNDIGGSGGGGAGAGIGGNGGAGGNSNTDVLPNVAENGHNGENSGYIHIVGQLNVYAYGGAGGSGGYVVNGDAGGGGGYPAAGIGGGGAGGGGGTTKYGGGGFSGGAGEYDTADGASFPSMVDGTGDTHEYAGGGYFTSYDASRLGGGAAAEGASTGGMGGKAGTIFADTTHGRIFAYNGNYVTSLKSGLIGNDWGENPTPIYAQLGYNINTVRANNVSNIIGKTPVEVKQLLNGISKEYSYNNIVGIGSGAGYTEESNGVYSPYLFSKNNNIFGDDLVRNLDTMSKWSFRVQTSSVNGLSTVSEAMDSTYLYTTPGAPTEITADWESPTSARLKWSGVTGAAIDRYYIYYTTTPNELVSRWDITNSIEIVNPNWDAPAKVSENDVYAGSNNIILYNAVKGIQYKLVNPEGDETKGQIWQRLEEKAKTNILQFTGLEPDKEYMLISRYEGVNEGDSASLYSEGLSIMTRPLPVTPESTGTPEEKPDASPSPPPEEEEALDRSNLTHEPISTDAIEVTTTSIKIHPAYYGSEYQILDENMQAIAIVGSDEIGVYISDWKHPVNNTVEYTGLTPDTKYYIAVRYSSMGGYNASKASEKVAVTTLETEEEEPIGPGSDSEEKDKGVFVEPVRLTSFDGEAIIKGLKSNNTYYFKMASGSIYQDKSEVSSATASTYLYNIPIKPEIYDLIPLNEGIRLHQIRTDDNKGSRIQKYIAYYYENDDITTLKSVDFPVAEDAETDLRMDNIEIRGLTNRHKYTIYVTAVNSAGESEASETLSVTAGTPWAPDPFRVHSGENRWLNLKYKDYEPTIDNGYPVKYYNIYKDGELYTTTTELEYAFTEGKFYGDTHTFEVSGVNEFGEGPKTQAVSRSIGAPSTAQVNNIVYYSDGSDFDENDNRKTGIDLSWDPANGNGEVINTYTIYLSEKGEPKETAFEIKVDPDTKLIDTTLHIPAYIKEGDNKITYLKYGQEYNVEIEATSIAGVGSRSEPYYFTFGAPSAPIITMAHGSDEIITTTFISTEGNGADVTAFNVYLDGELYAENVEGPPVVIDRLANGVDYKIEVTAINKFGESSKSVPVIATPSRQPGAPRDIVAVPLSGSEVKLSWKPPVNNGGYEIKTYFIAGYIVGNEHPEGSETDQDVSKYIKCDFKINDDNTAIVSGLSKGTVYEFEIFAINDNYSGYVGLSNEVTTLNTPDPPTITKAQSTAERVANPPVTLWWNPPETNGGAEVERYNVYLYDAANDTYEKINPTPIGDTAYTFTHEKMTRRNTYQLAVTAINEIGEGEYSEKKDVLMGAPYAPTITEVTTDSNSVHMEWKMPDLDCYVEGYRVYVNDMENSRIKIDDADRMYCDIDNLEWGDTLTLYVRSVNDVGFSPFSEPWKVTIGTSLPPVITNIINGFEQVTLKWEEPEETSSVEKYIIYSELNGIKTKVGEAAKGETQAVISGLTGGEQYTFYMTAQCNIENTGMEAIIAESEESNSVTATPWKAPDAPVIDPYSLIAGDGEFSFTIDKPNMYGLDFVRYEVYLDGVLLNEDNRTINDNKITVTGVANGKTPNDYGHDFSILAVGSSPLDSTIEYKGAEAESQVLTGLPQKATIDAVMPGEQKITIRYNVANAAKVGVTSYEITYTSAGVTNTIETSETVYTIEPLTNSVPCDIRVRGKNSWGAGEYSDPATAIPGTPKAPEFTKASAGDSEATLEWNVPETPPGSTIYKYVIYIDGELAYESNKNSLKVSNLTNGQVYKFQVAAVNENGTGTKSEIAEVIPGKVPGEVEGATLKALSDTEIELEWLDPIDNGGHGVEYYIVKHADGSTDNIKVNSDEKKAVVSGLEAGTWYNFIIIAANEQGEGDPYTTDSVRTMAVPSAPIIEKASSVNYTISSRWQAPADEGGTPILGYNVYISTEKGQKGVKVNDSLITGTSYTYSYDSDEKTPPIVIVSGTTYYVTAAAVNALGEGDLSQEMETQGVGNLAPSAPGRARDVTATPGDSRVLVKWNNPAYDGNDEITDYYIYAGESESTLAYRGKVDGTTYMYTVNNLNNGTNYVFAVRAINSKGQSDLSDYVWATPAKLNIPQQPTGLSYQNDSKKENMTISWNPVEGSGITYRVYVNGEYVETTDTSYTMPVGSGTKYSIQVSAVNDAGETVSQYIYARNNLNVLNPENVLTNIDADYDGELDEKIDYSVPYAPEVSFDYDVGEVNLYWNTPFDGNNTIRGYEIYVNGLCEATFDVDENGEPIDTTGKLTRDADGNYTLTETENITYNEAYSIQIAAVNGYGSGDKSEAMLMYLTRREYPSEVKAYQEDSKNEPNTVTVEWRVPDDVELSDGYILYVNGEAIRLYETDSLDNEGYMYDPETKKCKCHYKNADVNRYYIFRVSTAYKDFSESRISAAGRVFVEQYKPEAPTWDTEAPATGNPATDTEQASVTVKWVAPDCDITNYTIYVNGEAVAQPTAEETTYTYPVEDNKYYIFRITATNGETEGDISESLEYSTIPEEEIASNAPLAPENLNVELVYLNEEKELLAANENMIITWDPSEHDAAHLDPYGYDVYINGIAVGRVFASDSTTDANGRTIYRLAYTGSSPMEYGIYVRPFALGENSEQIIYGQRSKALFITTPKTALDAPVLTGTHDKITGTVVLNWNSVENADYYVVYTPNDAVADESGVRKIYDTTYTFNVTPDNDYEYIVVAMQEDTNVKSEKSNIYYLSTYDDVNIPADLPGAPRIVRSISDYESKVTVYWTPPEENAENIYGYYIVSNGKRVKDSNGEDVIIPVADTTMYGEYKYTFTVPENTTIPVMVVPFEMRNGQAFVGNASNIWNIRLELNAYTNTITDNPDLFYEVLRKDADGDGIVDEIGATATLVGTVNTGGAVATVTVKDRYGNKLAAVTAKTNFRINVPLSLDSTERYTLEVARNNYTTYRITGMDLNDSETRTRHYDGLIIYAGDVNSNGIIDSDDVAIVNGNYGNESPLGDVDSDGKVGVDDLSYVNMNYGKRDIEYTIDEYVAAQ